jgi:hypothetical protein
VEKGRGGGEKGERQEKRKEGGGVWKKAERYKR